MSTRSPGVRRSLTLRLGVVLLCWVPPKNGSHIRVLELYPEDPDRTKALAEAQAVNEEFHQPYQPTAEMLARDPGMHHTDTLDMAFVFSGEIDLITDVDEIHCTPGDCIIVRGVNHAWRVRGSEPCLMMGMSLDALPLK